MEMAFAILGNLLVCALIYVIFFRGREGRKNTQFVVREEMNAYYKQINKACFAVSMLSIGVGFLLTLAMIWEVFPRGQVMEKAWLSVAIFFGTAILVAVVNNAFSVRVVSKEKGEPESE